MTDKQIIKALRCWTGKTVKDEECAECSFGEDCTLGEIVDAAEKRINELAAENAALRERMKKAVELPYERKRLLWGDKDHETLLCPDCLTDVMGGIGDETFVVQCPNCGCLVNCMVEPIPFTEVEARLAELKGVENEQRNVKI